MSKSIKSAQIKGTNSGTVLFKIYSVRFDRIIQKICGNVERPNCSRIFVQLIMGQCTKSNEWADSIVSSLKTDESLQSLTIDALNRRNVYGVTSGDVSVVRKQWNFSEIKRQELTIDSLEKAFKSGEKEVQQICQCL